MGSSKAKPINAAQATERPLDSGEFGPTPSDASSDQPEVALIQFAQAQLATRQDQAWLLSQQFTLKRLLLVGPLVAILLSLPAAKWSPGAELHVILLVATGYAFVMITVMLPISLACSVIHWLFTGNRNLAFRVGFRTMWVMSSVALACLTYLVYSYCISMISR